MEFKNGFKLLYQNPAKDDKIFASKYSIPSKTDEQVTFAGITEEEFKEIKLVYEKNGELVFSKDNIPTKTDKPFALYIGDELVIGPSEGENPGPGPVPPIPADTPVKYFYLDKNSDNTYAIYTKESEDVDEPYSDVLKVPENNLINTLGTYFGKYSCISTKLKEVVIPDTIKTIGTDFLEGQDRVEKLSIGNGVEEFYKPYPGDFYNSPCIENYDAGHQQYVDNWLLTANYGIESGGPLLKSGIRGVADSAFADVFSYSSQFVIPNTLKAISSNGLSVSGCTATHLAFEENSSLRYIGDQAFDSICHGNFQVDLEIPDSVKYIGNYAFKSRTEKSNGLSYNAQNLSIGPNCNYIGNHAFDGWEIKQLNISVSEIGDYAFYDTIYNAGCNSSDPSFRALSLGEGITRIGAHAFDWNDSEGCMPAYYTNGLTIPSSVKTIGEHAFLQKPVSSENWTGIKEIGGFYVLDGWVVGYNASETNRDLSTVQPVRGIAANALTNYSGSWASTSSRDIKYLGTNSLSNAAFNTKLFLSNVSHVESGAFDNTYVNASDLYLPSVQYFGRQYFSSGSPTLTSNNGSYIYCSKNYWDVYTDGKKIFRGPANTSNFRAVDSDTTLWEDGPNFSGCQNLSSIAIPKEVTYLPDSAFRGCYLLSSISFACDSTLKYIGNSAFSGYCGGSTSTKLDLVLPESLESLGQDAFAGVTNLRSCNIPSKVTCLPQGVFNSTYSLLQVSLPENLISIEANAFGPTIQDIYYNNTAVAWKNISKADDWIASSAKSYVKIHCTDKTITAED